MYVLSWRCCAEGKPCKEANCSWHRVKLICTIYWRCTAGDLFRNPFTKKEDETEDEEQHNDHDEQDEEEDDQLDDWYLMR